MARAQIKLLLFLITLGIVVGCMATAWWIYENVLVKEDQIKADITQMKAPGRPPPDPGSRRFEAAIELVRGGKYTEARDALYKMLQQFPKSPTCVEAKRILGEMNMDALYALDASGGKKDYIVQPRDAVLSIASKNHTTVEAICRFNSLTSFNLQPGEHLFLIPMDFDLILDVSDQRLTVLREGLFFKQYDALKLALPQGTKVPSEMDIGNKSSVLNNKVVNPVSPDFVKADKRIVAYKSATTVGLIIRTPPKAKPVTEPKPEVKPAPKSTAKSTSKKGGAKAEDQPDDEEDSSPTSQFGLFLSSDDLEELYPILRKGSKLRLVQ